MQSKNVLFVLTVLVVAATFLSQAVMFYGTVYISGATIATTRATVQACIAGPVDIDDIPVLEATIGHAMEYQVVAHGAKYFEYFVDATDVMINRKGLLTFYYTSVVERKITLTVKDPTYCLTPATKKITIQPVGIQADERTSVPIVDESVKAIDFSTSTGLETFSVIAETIAEKPEGVPELSTPVLNYMHIETDLPRDAISFASIKFEVPKLFVTENSLTTSQIALSRLVGEDWVKLKTSLVGESASAYFFEAITPGFSYFAITVRSPEEGCVDAQALVVDDIPALEQTVGQRITQQVLATDNDALFYSVDDPQASISRTGLLTFAYNSAGQKLVNVTVTPRTGCNGPITKTVSLTVRAPSNNNQGSSSISEPSRRRGGGGSSRSREEPTQSDTTVSARAPFQEPTLQESAGRFSSAPASTSKSSGGAPTIPVREKPAQILNNVPLVVTQRAESRDDATLLTSQQTPVKQSFTKVFMQPRTGLPVITFLIAILLLVYLIKRKTKRK